MKQIKNNAANSVEMLLNTKMSKDAEEVAAYIEGLEAIVEDMKEVKELLDDNANVE